MQFAGRLRRHTTTTAAAAARATTTSSGSVSGGGVPACDIVTQLEDESGREDLDRKDGRPEKVPSRPPAPRKDEGCVIEQQHE